MEFPEKRVVLRDGRGCVLRSPGAEDAEQVLRHLRRTSGETPFMARYPEEVEISLREERAFLRRQISDPRRVMLSGFVEGRLAANGGLGPVNPLEKYRHRAQFGISILRRYWGLGLGGQMLEELCALAPALGYEQIELEVVCDNTRAVALYERYGFTVYGTRPASFRYRDGTYAGEYLMLKQL